MTKEEFNKIWKDTSKKGILNQYYYDYMYMKKLKEDINKAIEYIKETPIGSILEVHCGEEEEYTEPLLEILKGEDDAKAK